MRVGIQADIYGFAGVTVHLLTGRAPFHGCQMVRIFADVLGKRKPPPELKLLQKSGGEPAVTQARFRSRCFSFAPTDRPTASAVLDFCRSQLTIAEAAALTAKQSASSRSLRKWRRCSDKLRTPARSS